MGTSDVDAGTLVVPANDIGYLEFHDEGGRVAIANLRFQMVPEPTTPSLLGLSSMALVMAIRIAKSCGRAGFNNSPPA